MGFLISRQRLYPVNTGTYACHKSMMLSIVSCTSTSEVLQCETTNGHTDFKTVFMESASQSQRR
jgi:hypothetical protein